MGLTETVGGAMGWRRDGLAERRVRLLYPFGALACRLVLTYVVFLFIFIFLCFYSVVLERGLV